MRLVLLFCTTVALTVSTAQALDPKYSELLDVTFSVAPDSLFHPVIATNRGGQLMAGWNGALTSLMNRQGCLRSRNQMFHGEVLEWSGTKMITPEAVTKQISKRWPEVQWSAKTATPSNRSNAYIKTFWFPIVTNEIQGELYWNYGDDESEPSVMVRFCQTLANERNVAMMEPLLTKPTLKGLYVNAYDDPKVFSSMAGPAWKLGKVSYEFDSGRGSVTFLPINAKESSRKAIKAKPFDQSYQDAKGQWHNVFWVPVNEFMLGIAKCRIINPNARIGNEAAATFKCPDSPQITLRTKKV